MLDVLSYVAERKASIKRHVDLLKAKGHRAPRLAIVTDDRNFDANASYIKSKTKFAMDVGIDCDVIVLKDCDEFISRPQMYDGVIVQFPFRNYSFKEFQAYVTKHVPSFVDVDGLTKGSRFEPCTPLGIVRYLKYLRSKEVIGAHTTVNIIGAGGLVGRPLAEMLVRDPSYTVCVTRSNTDEWVADNFHATSDVVVCATPTHELIKAVDPRKVYVDCGCNLVGGKLLGNVSRACYSDEANITPVPFGVGRMTVLALFENVLDSYFWSC